MSYNVPLLSIPAFCVLALVPHIVGSAIAARSKVLNPTNPSGSQVAEQAKKKLPARDFAKYERCKSCHRNHIENLPLYVATILAGLYAERQTGQRLGLTTLATSFLVVRVLYTVNYSRSLFSDFLPSMLITASHGGNTGLVVCAKSSILRRGRHLLQWSLAGSKGIRCKLLVQYACMEIHPLRMETVCQGR